MKYLITISGPTASGKTSLGIQLAQHFKTVILSADSRQFYREMNIGTAKPTVEELAQAQHFFVDNLSIFDTYPVGQYEREAIELLDTLFQQHDVVLMVGGSGLFIKAVCEGLNEFPVVEEVTRETLEEIFATQGLEPLQKELQEKDPEYYAIVDKQNSKRLIRALCVIRSSNQTFTHFRNQPNVVRPFSVVPIALTMERTQLYERINRRVDLMVEAGLIEEAKNLHQHQHLNSLRTVGYQELFDYFNGDISKVEAIRLIKRNSRRYAKRQMTWLRNSMDGATFDSSDFEGILKHIDGIIKN